MARLGRKLQVLFGSAGAASNFGVFGSLAAGTPTTSKDLDTIQSLSAWTNGWQDETIADNRPALEDMNSTHYVAFYQLKYMFQLGVPEWIATETYYIGSIVNDGTGVLYKSIQDTNLNHAVSDGAWWTSLAATPFVPTPANALAGSVVQTIYSEITSPITINASIPYDNTKPQIGEGIEVLTATITPTNASNLLEITFIFNSVSGSANNITVAAVFLKTGTGSSADAIKASQGLSSTTSGSSTCPPVILKMVAGAATALIFSARVGSVSTSYVNADGGGTQLFNGTSCTQMIIREIKV